MKIDTTSTTHLTKFKSFSLHHSYLIWLVIIFVNSRSKARFYKILRNIQVQARKLASFKKSVYWSKVSKYNTLGKYNMLIILGKAISNISLQVAHPISMCLENMKSVQTNSIYMLFIRACLYGGEFPG